MESKHLVYLSVILEKGSISAAAEHLNIAQPTLTRAMATLEMQAGTQLFTRSRFGVSSTPVGHSLAREGRAIAQLLHSAEEQVSRYRLGIKQSLSIASGSLLSVEVMPRIIERVLQRHPEVALTATCITPSSAIECLIDDKLDFIIAPQAPNKSTASIHKEWIMDDQVTIYCGESHPLANVANVTIEDLKDQDWISLSIATYFEKQITDILEKRGIRTGNTKVVFRNDAVMLMKMLASGKYLAALPRFPVETLTHTFKVKEVQLMPTLSIDRSTFILCNDSLTEQPIYQSLSEITHEVFAECQREISER
ncbi:hypothetical protein DN730_07020 [Marinomonas piezotolerans]|uniref:HTH lysR-type domain-containing protein n=1 Tax=Marinomonas piezotolerans TaxID=2213058 RepID=A0A370UC25_9GAMM|nr:LysR family transcriptional regulator [Marinomonas piezotolerans]RDL45353.1 hypothetical protein DN730_07020 [Marinomonas piezotolerans]